MPTQTEKYLTTKKQTQAQIEQMFLKGKKNPALGFYSEIFSAKCGEGQDGGVVTALLTKGLEKGLFEGVIVVERKEGYCAEAVVAKNAAEVSAAKGTKYVRVQVTPKLRELISQGAKKVAIVCTPCEVLAARKIQQTTKNTEITIIGLFCFEAFNATKFKEKVKAHLGVDLDKAEKTQVRHGKFTAVVDGTMVSCKVRELEGCAERACGFCDDFTSRLADVSVGSVGSKVGYSTVIVRSEAGGKLVGLLDCVREAVDFEEIVRLSQFKEKRSKESFAALNNR